MTLFRRFLLVVCLAFWQGGFMFYGGVVVPVGASVLGSETEQGFITQSATNYLNLAGLVCLIVWGIALASDAPRRSRTGLTCWALWSSIVLILGVLIGFHVLMDRSLDVAGRAVLDEPKFLGLHAAYITLSTIQWLLCLALLAMTLITWRNDSARRSASLDP